MLGSKVILSLAIFLDPVANGVWVPGESAESEGVPE